MSKRMYANFSDDAYNDLMNGAAVDNNGLRSPKGSFYPDQPSFEPINERKEQLKDAGAQMLVDAAGALVFCIVLPEIQRFAHEKVYPFFVEQWDNWQEKRREKKAEKQATKIEPECSSEPDTVDETETPAASKIINFEEYRKMA